MKTIFLDDTLKLKKNRRKIENELDLKITISGNEVTIDGKPEDEFFA